MCRCRRRVEPIAPVVEENDFFIIFLVLFILLAIIGFEEVGLRKMS